MREHKINSQYDFLQGYYIEDNTITDNLINFFENSNGKKAGTVGPNVVKKNVKDSTDINIHPLEIKFFSELSSYFNQLENCLNIYKNKYEYCYKLTENWAIRDYVNIQKYKPTQGFHKFHAERLGLGTLQRHLVFMTYLNDVVQGGETEFLYQKLKVKPEKGLTLIWPVDWTFTHKGHTTINEDKYIITGWYDFIK